MISKILISRSLLIVEASSRPFQASHCSFVSCRPVSDVSTIIVETSVNYYFTLFRIYKRSEHIHIDILPIRSVTSMPIGYKHWNIVLSFFEEPLGHVNCGFCQRV